MNKRKLAASLKKHEGEKFKPYTCPAGKLTIAVGHNLSNPISQSAVNQILDDDIVIALIELEKICPTLIEHNAARQNVLIEMSFILGAGRLKAFKKMFRAFNASDYAQAAKQIINSKFAKQVKGRALTLAKQMETGIFQ